MKKEVEKRNFTYQYGTKKAGRAKTASRNVAFKAARLGDSIFGRQSEIRVTEVVTGDSELSLS